MIKIHKKKILTIAYFDDGAPKTEEVEYPGPNVGECGSKLTTRTDCDD